MTKALRKRLPWLLFSRAALGWTRTISTTFSTRPRTRNPILRSIRNFLLFPIFFTNFAIKLSLWFFSFSMLDPSMALLWRKRKYLADASAVQLTRNPDGLAEALRKLNADRRPDSRWSMGGASFSRQSRREAIAWMIPRQNVSNSNMLGSTCGRPLHRKPEHARPNPPLRLPRIRIPHETNSRHRKRGHGRRCKALRRA